MRHHRLMGLAILIVLAAAADLTVLAWRYEHTPHLARGPVPMSRFIAAYRRRDHGHPLLPLRWQPVALAAVPERLRQAVILAEDGSFYTNDGFDVPAIWAAARYDWRAQRLVYGASTLTQQLAKNMFLDPARTFFRKANEALLTVVLAHTLSKNRILELYLDDAQFGRGVYGVQAAAEYYFHRPVGALNRVEEAELAATLPDPVGSNPDTDSRYFRRRTAKILALMSGHTSAVCRGVCAPIGPRIAATPTRLYSGVHGRPKPGRGRLGPTIPRPPKEPM